MDVVSILRMLPLGAGLLTAFSVILKWPFVAFLLMLALIPMQELTAFLGGHTFIWGLGIGVLSAWFFRIVLTKERIRIARTPLTWAILWLMWGSFSFFWATDQTAALGRIFTLVYLIAFYFLFQALVKDTKRLRTVCSVYFISAVTTVLISIPLGASVGLKRLVLVSIQNPNAFAGVLAIGLLMTPYIFNSLKSRRLKFLTVCGAVALGIAILMTGSRGVWVGLIAASIFTWLVTRGKTIRLRTIFVSGIVIVAGITMLYNFGIIGDWMIQRIITIPNVEATRGGSGRTNIWLVGWEMVKANPVIGVGLQNFPARFERYVDAAGLCGAYGIYPGRDPHNIFLAVQAELGIVGLILFVGFLWSILKGLYSYRFTPGGTLGLLMLFFLIVFGLVRTILYQKSFWLGISLATVIPLVVQNERDSGAYPDPHVS